MGDRPSKKHSIDRVDNNKGYYKGNCVWATAKTQARNTRANRLITYNGITQTLIAWSDQTGLNPDTIAARLKRGWGEENALTIRPLKKWENLVGNSQ